MRNQQIISRLLLNSNEDGETFDFSDEFYQIHLGFDHSRVKYGYEDGYMKNRKVILIFLALSAVAAIYDLSIYEPVEYHWGLADGTIIKDGEIIDIRAGQGVVIGGSGTISDPYVIDFDGIEKSIEWPTSDI